MVIHVSSTILPILLISNMRRGIMSFSRILAVGTGTAIGLAIGRFSGNVAVKSETVFEHHQGSHLHRMYEVAMAHFTQRNINDNYTALNHVATVTTLSLRGESEDDDEKKRTIRDLNYDFMRDAHYYGHLYNNPSFVFAYVKEQDVPLPICPSKTDEGFIYAGTSSTLHHSQSRHDILSGNYIRCKSAAIHEKPLGQYHEVDVLVTGTTNCHISEKIKKAILVEAAKQVVKMPLP